MQPAINKEGGIKFGYSFICLSSIVLVEGIFNLTGHLYPSQSLGLGKYTEDSIKKSLRPTGALDIIVAVGLILTELFFSTNRKYIILIIAGIAILVVGIIGTYVIMKKFYVKKTDTDKN